MKKEKRQKEFNPFMSPIEFEAYSAAWYCRNIIEFYLPAIYLVSNGIFEKRIIDLIVGLCPIAAQIFWFFAMRQRDNQVKQYVSEKLDELEKTEGSIGEKVSHILRTIIYHNQKMNK